jgi:hypothetical protein
MPTPQELEAKFWKALRSDMTMMLGLDGVEDGHARPIAERAEIWLDEYSLVAGVKMMLGIDPKEDYRDKVAEVKLKT